MLAHVVLLKLLEQGTNGVLVCRLLRILGALLLSGINAVDRTEVLVVRDVEEVYVLLYSVSNDRKKHTLDVGYISRIIYVHDEAPTSPPQSPIASRQETAQ